MARVKDLISQVATLISGITEANGFDYDWGSVNQSDMARMNYPSADIIWQGENLIGTDDASGHYCLCLAEIDIQIRCELDTISNTPRHAIDEEYSDKLSDVKHVLLGQSTLPLTDQDGVIKYVSAQRMESESADALVPGYLLTKWTIQYQSIER